MPNQDISLTSYDPDVANIRRQQRLADMLQQQSMQDIPINSYNGIQAPISPFSVLAKMLGGYVGYKSQERADQAIKDYHDKDISSAQALARQLTQGTNQVGTPSMPAQAMNIDATMPQLPGGPAPEQRSVQATLPAQQGTGMTTAPPSMNDQLAMILSADGGPQTEAIRNAMLPQIMQRQNFDYQHGVQRQDKQEDNLMPMSTAMGQQIAAQGAQTQRNEQFKNDLPQTANERAVTGLGYAQLNKPVAMPFMGSIYDPRTRSVFTPGGGAGNETSEPDPNSNSLTGATGLSQMAIDRMQNAPNQPRTANLVTKTDQEIQKYSKDRHVDFATVRAQAKGVNDVLSQNVMRNNQANILEREIAGSMDNVAPILDQLNAGKINKGNLFRIWAGQQVNDPAALQAADQLGRFRNELAGYNAVAGGHLMENGTPAPTPADFAHVDKIISEGINSGGARAVSQSVAMSAQKNRVVLANAIDDANQQMWELFGVGKQYKRKAPPLGGGGGGNNVQTATEADIQHTMQVRKMTRAQVLDALKAKGIPVAP